MQHKTQRYAAPVQHREPDAVDTSWDALRAFLVCADQRSFRRAADVLGLSGITYFEGLAIGLIDGLPASTSRTL